MRIIRNFAERHLERHDVLGRVPCGLRLEVWWRVAIHRRCRFVYVRIPKAANSTISKTLALHAWPERARWMEKRDAIWAKRQYRRFGPGATVDSLLNDYYTFSFFRNPYSRTLSAYLQKLRKPKYRWAARAAGVERVDQHGFRAFVDWLEDGNLNANIHWAPQSSICPLPISRLDFRGRVERLDEDLATLIGKLFPDADYRQPATRRRDRQHAAGKLSAFYTGELARRVYALYRDDFEQLGYEPELPADKSDCPAGASVPVT